MSEDRPQTPSRHVDGEIGIYYISATLMGPLQESFWPGPLIMNDMMGGEEGTKARASYFVGTPHTQTIPNHLRSSHKIAHRLLLFSEKSAIVWAVAIRKTSEHHEASNLRQNIHAGQSDVLTSRV